MLEAFSFESAPSSERVEVQKKATFFSVRSRSSMTWSIWLPAPALAITSVPTSGSSIMKSMICLNSSRRAKPVTSAGFAAQPKSFRIPLMPSRARALNCGRSSPAWPSMSAVSELTPPECETTAMPRFSGLRDLASSCDTSSSSS
jgi:hypothetical protein